jgi:hypothetical protein
MTMSSNSRRPKGGTSGGTGTSGHKRSKSSDSNSATGSNSDAPVSVTFETVLRIRPLLKKEREDAIVLEKLVTPITSIHGPGTGSHRQSNHNNNQNNSCLVALRPLPKKQEPEMVMSPGQGKGPTIGQGVVMQTLSPDASMNHTSHSLPTVTEHVHAHDLEFQLDHALSADANQEKVYYSLGLPVALSIMEPLKVHTSTAASTANTASHTSTSTNSTTTAAQVQVPKKTHLIIGMGVATSGKTFTCWGGGPISKRKAPTDGLIPRFVDSLFSQSQHNLTKKKNQQNTTFGVNLSILQVNQSTSSTHTTKPDDCTMHDLLQPLVKSNSLSASLSLGIHVVRAMSATMESATSAGSGSGSLHGSSHSTATATSSATSRSSSPKKSAATSSSQYNSLDEPVTVEQDVDSAEFYTVNAQIRTCKTAEQAREALQTAVQHSRKLSNAKRYQSHVLVKLQPVLLDRRGHIVESGGMVAVLDMAGANVHSTSNKGRHRSTRIKDAAIAGSRDAHAAIFHCLRTLQHNQLFANNVDSSELDSSLLYDSSASTDMNNNNKPSFGRQLSLKKVPYRQHKLTMLLQPLFSAKKTDQTVVTLLLTASPGHRDYSEKKILLADLETFRSAPPAQAATTGLRMSSSSATSLPRKKDRSSKRERKKVVQQVAVSDADDEGSLGHHAVGTSTSTPPRTTFVAPKRQGRVPTVTTVNGSSMLANNRSPMVPTLPSLIRSVPSMTYSDDEDDKHVLVPLPPPIAPTYIAPTFEEPIQQDHSLHYQNILKPAASVPLEVAAVDFPGVIIPENQLDKSLSMSASPRSSAPPEHQAVPLRSSTFPNTTKFSPMKTINKVVSASKKKGIRVFDKMNAAIPKDVAVIDKDMQARFKKLEAKNAELLRENLELRDKHEELVQENQELRSKLSRNDSQGTGAVDLKYSSSMEVDEPPAVQATLPHKKVTHSRESSSSERDENRRESPPRRQQESMMDDPLFRHMAQVSGKRPSSHKDEERVRENQEEHSKLNKNDSQGTGAFNLKYSSSMEVDENKVPPAVPATLPYKKVTHSRESSSSEQDENRWEPPPRRQQGNMMDDPLFQHMAHLSGNRQSNHKDEGRVRDDQKQRSELNKNGTQGAFNLKCSSSMEVDEKKLRPAVQGTLPAKNVTRSLESSSSERDENRRESPPRRQQGNMMDDPLFQHMAHLSGNRQVNSPWTQSSTAPSSSSHKGHFSLQVPSAFNRSQY